MNARNLPCRATQCATCPFRPGSKYACLASHLTASALSEASRICHSTGISGISGVNRRTGKAIHLCRGARDMQLRVMASMGVIAEASDEAWNDQRVKIGMKATVIKDPV